eukprot:NODE_998_length_2393_cov_0.079773.p1 type:complete len:540 gc:universal NODE_998_length_2393_cov_0.079773:2143-524(-)
MLVFAQSLFISDTLTASSSMLLATSTSVSNLSDCEKVVNFALGLKMNIAQPAEFSRLQSNCCNAPTIVCDGDTVTKITWTGLSLSGKMDGNYIPSRLEELYLGSNYAEATGSLRRNTISGTIPTNMPNTLTNLYLDYNMLTGSIPNPLPSNLQNIGLEFNQLTGSIPPLPIGTLILNVGVNKLSGPLPELPLYLSQLSFFQNMINGTFPKLPEVIWVIWAHGNRMTGDVPAFPKSLSYLGLGYPQAPGNLFTGVLNLYRPAMFYLNNNWITNVIIQYVDDITDCDISYNPLLEHANEPALAYCAKIGLYSANSLPKTETLKSITQFSSNVSLIPVKTIIPTSIVNDDSNTSLVINQETIGEITTETSKVTRKTIKNSVTSVVTSRTTRTTHSTQTKLVLRSVSKIYSTYYTTEVDVIPIPIKLNLFVFDFSTMFRVMISALFMGTVLSRSPFLRELRKKKIMSFSNFVPSGSGIRVESNDAKSSTSLNSKGTERKVNLQSANTYSMHSNGSKEIKNSASHKNKSDVDKGLPSMQKSKGH